MQRVFILCGLSLLLFLGLSARTVYSQTCNECKEEKATQCQKKCVAVRSGNSKCMKACYKVVCADECDESECDSCLDVQFSMCAQKCMGIADSPRKMAVCQIACSKKSCKTSCN